MYKNLSVNDLPISLRNFVSDYLEYFHDDEICIVVLQKQHLRHFGFKPSDKLILKYKHRKITIFPESN